MHEATMREEEEEMRNGDGRRAVTLSKAYSKVSHRIKIV